MINEKVHEQQLSISKLSIISFFFSVFSYVLLICILIFGTALKTLGAIAPFIMLLFSAISLILSIIDLTRKNRKKVLSIIALVLSSLYFFIIIMSLILVFDGTMTTVTT